MKRVDSNNDAGLVNYVHTSSNAHYKTTIGNEQKFVQFCERLGLKTIAFETVTEEKNRFFKVTFKAYKGIKANEPQEIVKNNDSKNEKVVNS